MLCLNPIGPTDRTMFEQIKKQFSHLSELLFLFFWLYGETRFIILLLRAMLTTEKLSQWKR